MSVVYVLAYLLAAVLFILGLRQLSSPKGARNGMKLRLKERGLPGKPPGHLYLLLEIALPPADSEPVRAAYEQLAKAAPFNPRQHLGA